MAMAIGIVGGIMSAVGSFVSMQAQAQAAEYNAKIAARNSRAVSMQTANEIDDTRVHNRRVIGMMRAAYGANGFDMAGSPMDVLSDTIETQEYDVAKIKYQGAMKAEGYTEQASLFKMEAKSAKVGAFMGLATGLLGTAGNAINDLNAPGMSLQAA